MTRIQSSRVKAILTSTALCFLHISCKQKPIETTSLESAGNGNENRFSQQKKMVDNLKNFVSKIGPNISYHVKHLIRNSPYGKFGGAGGFSLENSDEATIDFNSIDFDSISALPVPTTPDEIAALNNGNSWSDSFALTESGSHGGTSSPSSPSSHSGKSGVPNVMKGLYDYLLCNSPLVGLYAFASTNRIPVLGAFSHLSKLAVKIPLGMQGQAKTMFPALTDPGRAVELEVFGGVSLHGPNAGFAAKITGVQLWKLAYREGVEGSLKEGLSQIHEVDGIPIGVIPQGFSAAAWNSKEMSLFVYQDFEAAAVGVKMTFSFEKLAQIGDLNAWRNGRTCGGGHE